MNTDVSAAEPTPTGPQPSEKKSNRASVGIKVTAIVFLVLASVLGLLTALLKPHENTAYWMGTLMGATMVPGILVLIVIGFTSIFKALRTSNFRWSITLLFGVIFTITQCTSAIRQLGKAGRASAEVAAPSPASPEVLTPKDIEEIRAACAAFEQGVPKSDYSAFEPIFDIAALVDRAAEGLTIPPATLSSVRTGALNTEPVSLLSTPVTRAVEQGTGGFSLLRVQESETEARALFRVRLDGGLNYQEWYFQKRAGESPRIVDVYVFTSGELFSETFRRTALYAVMGDGAEQKAEAALALFKKINAMALATQENRQDDAKKIFEEMPKEQQENKLSLLMYLTTVSNLTDEEYTAAAERFNALYPNDPGWLLLSVDYYLLKKELDTALAQIDRLDALVHDPMLDGLRSNLYAAAENYEAAEAAARRAVEQGVAEEDTYWSLLTALVYQRKFDEAVQITDVLKTAFDADVDPNADDNAYRAFIASKPFRKWKKSVDRGESRGAETI